MLRQITFKAVAVLTIGLLISSVPGTASAQQVVVHENFDSGIDGWTFSPEIPNASMSWDPLEGSPDLGSLRLSAEGETGGRIVNQAFGRCISHRPEDEWVFEILFKPEITDSRLSLFCFAHVSRYTGPDCTGSFTSPGNLPPNQYGWQEFGVGVGHFPGRLSARVVLTMVADSNGITDQRHDCYFDAIRLTNRNPPPAPAIPTLSWGGLLFLVLTIAGMACQSLLRRRIR